MRNFIMIFEDEAGPFINRSRSIYQKIKHYPDDCRYLNSNGWSYNVLSERLNPRKQKYLLIKRLCSV